MEGFRELFTKHDHMIPMRDGVKLYTTLFVPKLVSTAAADSSALLPPGPYTDMAGMLHLGAPQGPDGGPPPPMPMLMKRTPYSVAPYGIDSYPAPSGWFKTYAKEGWIFVYQVRGSASAQWPETRTAARAGRRACPSRRAIVCLADLSTGCVVRSG
eukprot:COSAG02_NODE_8502_length_2546_cov_308.865141_6_plen_156_part_00